MSDVKIDYPSWIESETIEFMEEVIGELESRGPLNKSMLGSLIMLMHQYNAFILASKEVGQDGGVTTRNLREEVVIHPAFNVMAKVGATVLGYLKDFGLTPRSSAALKAAENGGSQMSLPWENPDYEG